MNNFQFAVVATDKYSKTFRDLNDKAAKSVRPLTSIGRQFGAISKELRFDKAAKGIERLSAGASTLTRHLGLSLGPLESLFGLGTAGGIAGGLAIAGTAAVAVTAKFGSMGFEISRTAGLLGVSTDWLQQYRGAAKQAGVSSSALDGAVRGLSDSLYRGFYDGDARVLQTLNYLGISLKKNVDGSYNLEDALAGVSRAMQKYTDPNTRRRIAEVFGIPEDAIPLLQLGEKGMAALAQRTVELGDVAGPKALAWATDFEASLNRLKVALEGVALRAGANLIPKTPTWLDAVTKAISPSPPSASTSVTTKYPRGGTKPPPGFFDDAIDWFNTFDARSRAASPRAAHGQAGRGAVTAPAPQAGPGLQAAALGPGDEELGYATQYLNGPRDIARERAAFQQGAAQQHSVPATPQKVHISVDFTNAPPGMRPKVSSDSPAVSIGYSMNGSAR